jgi:hypothetical protein
MEAGMRAPTCLVLCERPLPRGSLALQAPRPHNHPAQLVAALLLSQQRSAAGGGVGVGVWGGERVCGCLYRPS